MKMGILELILLGTILVGGTVILNQALFDKPKTLILTVDAPLLTQRFNDERMSLISMEDIPDAMMIFDQLVIEAGMEIADETGIPIVNQAHVLAGGNDVTYAVLGRVFEKWDEIKWDEDEWDEDE